MKIGEFKQMVASESDNLRKMAQKCRADADALIKEAESLEFCISRLDEIIQSANQATDDN